MSQEPTTGAAGSAQEEHEDQEFAEDQAEQESAEQESAEEQTAEEAPSEVIMVREPPPRRTYTNPLRVQSAGRKKSGK